MQNGHGGPSPALLTSYIKKAWTVEALFRTCCDHESHFNHIHLSACWNALGRLVWAADQQWFQKHARALESPSVSLLDALAALTPARKRSSLSWGSQKPHLKYQISLSTLGSAGKWGE